MARVLICGTLAYDDIGRFASPWSPATRNVKLDTLDRGFGGCAMNIAYNLAGLGHQAVPFVYAGDDYAGDYARHTARHGISEAGVFRIAGSPSARGIVLTGRDGVQFTAFYPGPSGLERWRADLDALLESGSFDATIVAPDLPEKMAGCARRTRDLPLRIWCPGQYAELLDDGHIEAHLGSGLLIVNRHEWHSLGARVTKHRLVEGFDHVIVTDGPGAVTVLPGGDRIAVPRAGTVIDPTGCGDAFVAALVAAVLEGKPLTAAVRAGIELAGACLGRLGAQAHLPPSLIPPTTG
jgi:adenosine kinase